MRITNVVLRQHIGWMFKKHWKVQGNRTPIDAGAESVLKARGITAIDPKEFLEAPNQPKREK